MISHIQRFSTHDGPGIRTTVFFKGCNMKCAWCHNPETLSSSVQVGLIPEKCTQCGQCPDICPEGAISLLENGNVALQEDKCTSCGKCVDRCYSGVFIQSGKKKSVEELVNDILQDRVYFKNSKGGVTFSGGEPLLQAEYLSLILEEMQKEGVHTIIQSNLSIPFNAHIIKCLRSVDLMIVDLKFHDSFLHRKWTGIPNQTIITNLRKLGEKGIPVEVRTPLVDSVNDEENEILAIAEIVENLESISSYTLVPYHPLGLSKYRHFQIKPLYHNDNFYKQDKLERLQSRIEQTFPKLFRGE